MAKNPSQTNHDSGINSNFFASGRVLSSDHILTERDICLACTHISLTALFVREELLNSGRWDRGNIQETLQEYIGAKIPQQYNL